MAADFYETLGVDRNATTDDIKRAYRKLAHQHHPDRGGDEEKFKQVNEAYQVLSDEQKRSQYDRFGQTFEQAGAGGGNPFGGVNVDFSDIGDIFNDFFGGRAGGRTRSAVRRGADIEIDITLSFIESAREQKRDVRHRLYVACEHCHASGAEPGTAITTCPTCQGRGQVTTTRQTVFGVFAQSAVCPECHGEGKLIKTPCTVCHRHGRLKQERTLEVTIPAGIADGQTLRITGKGEVPERGGTAGDLFVNVHVRPEPGLQRQGDDVRSTASISFIDASLGTAVPIKTLDGQEHVSIPAGTQPGESITLRNKGFPHLGRSGRGDQVVTVQVTIPKKLSRQQKKLLEDFRGAKKKGIFF